MNNIFLGVVHISNNEWPKLCREAAAKGSLLVPSRRSCIRDNVEVVNFRELSELPGALDVPSALMVSQKDFTVNAEKTFCLEQQPVCKQR